MTRVNNHRNQGEIKQKRAKANSGESTNHNSNQQTITSQQAIELAIQHHTSGRLSEAKTLYQQALKTDSMHPVALHFLGVIAHQTGDNETAIELISKAIVISPNLVDAHNNLGVTLKALERFDEAVISFDRAIAIKPDYAEAHYNLGLALQGMGRLDAAVASYKQALTIIPGYAEAHYNLGIAFQDMGSLNAAITSYRQAITFNSTHAMAYNNLGTVLQDTGKLEEAVTNYATAIKIKPNFAEAWNGLKNTVKALSNSDQKSISYRDLLNQTARATTDFAMLEYFLDRFRPHESDKNLKKAVAALPSATEESIPINARSHQHAKPPQLPEKVFALLHFGRSGTGLLHSLIDNHPEVSTLPGIYLRGYFNAGVWNKISAGGWQGLPKRFTEEFTVLFDARSPKPTPGLFKESSIYLGKSEGMANVGKNHDKALSLNHEDFCTEALRLLKRLDNINPEIFLRIVHMAYERVLKTRKNKNIIFYHIHNPDDFAILNFLRYIPDARLIMMVREPIRCFESWIRINFENNDYKNIVQQMVTMLYAFDQIAFRTQDSVGIRLEDLKDRPELTLQALCNWLGIQESPTLYQMTAQGEKWWGDPSSPDYNINEAMSPFGKSSTKRTLGTIFSEKDQFILQTLFYPFSVRFGYRKADRPGFEKDLKKIPLLLDKMFDFEQVISARLKIKPAKFIKSGAYIFLRACLMDRWHVLDEYKDYPHMLSTLNITAE